MGLSNSSRGSDKGQANELASYQDELDAALAVIVEVARGAKGKNEAQEWILAHYPELLPI